MIFSFTVVSRETEKNEFNLLRAAASLFFLRYCILPFAHRRLSLSLEFDVEKRIEGKKKSSSSSMYCRCAEQNTRVELKKSSAKKKRRERIE